MPTDATSWTIKRMPVAVRKRAIEAANAQDQTVPEWMTDAVNRLADQQAGNEVFPPGKPPGKPPANRHHEPMPLPDLDLAGLGAAILATVEAFRAAGETPPKNLGTNAAATLNKYLRAARGLSDGKPQGKLPPQIGQTISVEHEITVLDVAA